MTEREKQRREAPLRQVEAYWHGLCDGTSVPLRSQIDPRGMESALENAFLMERIAPTMAKIRVAGTHLNDLMGMQVAGMPLSSLIAPPDRERFGKAIASLFADPAVVRIELKAETGFGKPEITASMLLMPLRSDFGDMTRGLGALISHGRIGRTPRRFTITQIHISPALDGVPVKAKTPETDAPTPINGQQQDPNPGIVGRERIKLDDARPVMRFNEAQERFSRDAGRDAEARSVTGPEARRNHLRLVVDND